VQPPRKKRRNHSRDTGSARQVTLKKRGGSGVAHVREWRNLAAYTVGNSPPLPYQRTRGPEPIRPGIDATTEIRRTWEAKNHEGDPFASSAGGRTRASEKRRKKRENGRRDEGRRTTEEGTRSPLGLQGRDSWRNDERRHPLQARRPPRTAAVVLTCEGGSASYAEALRKARERITLADLNIAETKIRRAATGAVIIQIPGENMKEKADLLANKMKEELSELGVRISGPTRTAEIRIYNLDDSVMEQDILEILTQRKDFPQADIKLGQKR